MKSTFLSSLYLFALYLFCVLSVAACASFNSYGAKPALLVSKNTQTHLEISTLIAHSTGQDHLKLSASMFAETSILALEKADMTGRQLDMPIRFQLLKKGEACFLKNMQTDKRWKLEHAQCDVNKVH